MFPHLGRVLVVLPAGCGGMTEKAIIINRLLAAPQGHTYQRPEIGVAPNRLLCRARSGLVPDYSRFASAELFGLVFFEQSAGGKTELIVEYL